MACFLHDISNGALVRVDHGYWSAQLVAPYVDEEVAWAIRYHQPLRYFADESVGYQYPEAYKKYFGADYQVPEYIRRDHELARAHRWYMTWHITRPMRSRRVGAANRGSGSARLPARSSGLPGTRAPMLGSANTARDQYPPPSARSACSAERRLISVRIANTLRLISG